MTFPKKEPPNLAIYMTFEGWKSRKYFVNKGSKASAWTDKNVALFHEDDVTSYEELDNTINVSHKELRSIYRDDFEDDIPF